MSKIWKAAAIMAVVAVVGMAAAAAVVVAQEPPADEQGVFANLRQEMHEAISKALGISVEQYDAALGQARDEVLDNAVQGGRLTKEQADRMRERAELGMGAFGGMMGGRGAGRGMMGGNSPMMGGDNSSLVTIAAEKLGMSVDALRDELQAGTTIAELAQEKGVDVQTVIDAFVAGRQEWLDEAVANGRLTQEQADQMLANMRDMAEQHVEGGLPLGGGDCDGPFGGGRGRMHRDSMTPGRNF